MSTIYRKRFKPSTFDPEAALAGDPRDLVLETEDVAYRLCACGACRREWFAEVGTETRCPGFCKGRPFTVVPE